VRVIEHGIRAEVVRVVATGRSLDVERVSADDLGVAEHGSTVPATEDGGEIA
jgi:hypothetical protein